MLITYFMPGMHERYLYLGDITSIIWFVVIGKIKYWFIPLGVNLFSIISYIRCVTVIWATEYSALIAVVIHY